MIALGGMSPASAHDFWIQPSSYWVRPVAPTPMTLEVGHGPFRLRSPIPLRRILRFDLIAGDGKIVSQRERLALGSPAKDGDFATPNAGTFLLVLQTDNLAQSHLPAIRYNDYLKVEGLTPALTLRMRLGRMDADGSENYSRCAKSIIQVGPPNSTSSAQVTRAVGLPLEIVPERNPYADQKRDTLPVRVLYLGRPLPGALVKLTDLKHDAAPFESHVTDRSGRAVFTMPRSGAWLLNVIWTRPQPSSAETDFDTIFSSLSFGFA